MNDDAVLDQQLIQAWREAAEDLGIDVIAPFVLQINGRELRFEVLIQAFGVSKGIHLVRDYGVNGGNENREVHGLGCGVIHVMGGNLCGV